VLDRLRGVGVLQTLRRWLRAEPADPEAVAEAKRLEEDKITIRISQTGRQPYVGIPPSPDVLDPEREHR
jgi:hypothetical protein